MMKKVLTVCILLGILIIYTTAFGADSLTRLMNNDQEALVIAEVVASDDNLVEFRVEKSIASKRNLNESSKIKQIKVDKFKLNYSDLSSVRFYENLDTKDMFKKGEVYLVSLNKKLTVYQVAWGVYKLSGLDYKTLNVEFPKVEPSPEWTAMEAMAVKEFINSDGVENEFSFDGEENIVRSGKRTIYDGNSKEMSEQDENISVESKDKTNQDIEVETNLEKNYKYLIYLILVILLWILIKKSKILKK